LSPSSSSTSGGGGLSTSMLLHFTGEMAIETAIENGGKSDGHFNVEEM